MNKLKIGIIGCGKQASKHLRALKQTRRCEFVLADIDSDRARKMASEMGCDWISTPDLLFERPKCSAVVICTPTQTHIPLIRRALACGMHIFCEKPLSDDLNEIIALKAEAADAGVFVTVGYIYRYVPVFETGYALFASGDDHDAESIMSRPLTALFRVGGRGSHRAWKHRKETGGGAVNEMLVHMVDLANWYFGPLKEIQVMSAGLYLPQRVIAGETITADAEDFIVVRCRGKEGVEIYLQADLLTPAFSQFVEIQAENGSFRGSIQADSPCYLFLKEGRGGYAAGRTDLNTGPCDLIGAQTSAFVASLINGQAPQRNTIEDSLQLNQVIESIRAQMET